ncbi:MAG: alpha-L-fucosidase [Clostridia bacterium]|nr:alpha-L-fucosidase [Clostridia bacterium]
MEERNNSVPVPAPYIARFEQHGLGMYVHLGLYSLLHRGEWAMHFHHIDHGEYRELMRIFRPVSMEEIVKVGKDAGCKYICLTTRHHDGFSLYDTCGLNTYDAPHALAGRDLVREFVDACRKEDVVPHFYHTTLDWVHPDFKNDFPAYLAYLRKSVELLCKNYGPIGGFEFDGNWSRKDVDWEEDALYSMIRRYQPEAMIINNTGLSQRGALGNEHIDSVTYEQGLPTPIDRRGMKKYVAAEMAMTLNSHWGDADDYNFKSPRRIIEDICACRKVGANMLLNVGPGRDGTVPLMSRALMNTLGKWMRLYGTAIYNGRPYLAKEGAKDFILRDAYDETVFYLFKHDLGINGDPNVTLAEGGRGVAVFEDFPKTPASVTWMDNGEALQFEHHGDTLTVGCTDFRYGQNHCVRVARIIV